MTVRESLIVERKPFGVTQCALCRGELLEDGTLIARVVETGAILTRFTPGTWASARGVGVRDLEFYTLQPSDAMNEVGEDGHCGDCGAGPGEDCADHCECLDCLRKQNEDDDEEDTDSTDD